MLTFCVINFILKRVWDKKKRTAFVSVALQQHFFFAISMIPYTNNHLALHVIFYQFCLNITATASLVSARSLIVFSSYMYSLLYFYLNLKL